MYVISKKGSKNVYAVKNTFEELGIQCPAEHLESWRYYLDTFGRLVIGDWQYFYVANFDYEPGRQVFLWYHLLQKNWMYASYQKEDYPLDIFTHRMYYP